MMRSSLVLLLAATGSAQKAQYTTITDSGSDDASSGIKWVREPTTPAPAAPRSYQGNEDQISALLGGSPSPRASTPSHKSSSLPSFSMSHSYSHGNDLQYLSSDSMQVVKGLVEAFMHKVELMPGEKRCLENNLATFTGDIMGTVGDAVTATKALIAGKGTIPQGKSGGLMSAGMDGAMKLFSLVTLSTTVLKNCVHGDALDLLKKTGRHLVNAKYLEHRILVNGVDIARSLSDSILAFESKRFHRFGTDIGVSLRKILLSKSEHSTRLPEGVPEKDIIGKSTQGLMDGFFVRGSSFDITDTADPNVHVHVNLHRCIAGNSQFFKEIWMGAWDLFAQLSVNKEQHGLSLKNQHGQPKWQGELMIAMMQVPMALSKCGVGANAQQMFTDAIQSLNGLHVHFQFPDNRVSGKEATERMAKAVEAWTRWDFERFGYELGKVFRELVMLAFPQKYSVDANGRLQLRPLEKKSGPIFVPIVGGAVVSFAAAFLVVRLRHGFKSSQPQSDFEVQNFMDVEGAEVE